MHLEAAFDLMMCSFWYYQVKSNDLGKSPSSSKNVGSAQLKYAELAMDSTVADSSAGVRLKLSTKSAALLAAVDAAKINRGSLLRAASQFSKYA